LPQRLGGALGPLLVRVLGPDLFRCGENFLLAAVCHGERGDNVYGLGRLLFPFLAACQFFYSIMNRTVANP
jgi:hypothetical protein